MLQTTVILLSNSLVAVTLRLFLFLAFFPLSYLLCCKKTQNYNKKTVNCHQPCHYLLPYCSVGLLPITRNFLSLTSASSLVVVAILCLTSPFLCTSALLCRHHKSAVEVNVETVSSKARQITKKSKKNYLMEQIKRARHRRLYGKKYMRNQEN